MDTSAACQTLKDQGLEAWVRARTGLVLNPYFSGTKAAWLLDNVPGARSRAEAGELCFGTIDTWLAWRLCGAHATDPSNASRTLLFNIHTMQWDPELLDLFQIPAASLPRVADNAEVLGETRGLGFLPDGIPVAGMAGDPAIRAIWASLFYARNGQMHLWHGCLCVDEYGPSTRGKSHGLVSTVGWRLNGQTTYALEGSAFIAGAAVQWLRDGLGLIESASEIESLAASVSDSGGVVFVPALAGLGAPHWRPEARGWSLD